MNEIMKVADLDIISLKEKFINYLDIESKSIQTYEMSLRQFVEYMRINNIKSPKREDIINFRDTLILDHKPTTVQTYMIALRQFFKWLEFEGIYKNITENVKGIKLEQQHLKSGLSEEQIEKVLEACKDNKEKLIIKLAISIAGRCNEIVNIRLQDFYEDTGVIMLKLLGKGRNGLKQDSVRIDDRIFNEIKEYIKEYNITDYLFVSNANRNRGQQITTKTLRLTIKDIFKRAGLENIDMLSAHSLRHTSVELALKSGLSIEEVSQSVRHKSINTTMIYAKELDKKTSLFANNICNVLFN